MAIQPIYNQPITTKKDPTQKQPTGGNWWDYSGPGPSGVPGPVARPAIETKDPFNRTWDFGSGPTAPKYGELPQPIGKTGAGDPYTSSQPGSSNWWEQKTAGQTPLPGVNQPVDPYRPPIEQLRETVGLNQPGQFKEYETPVQPEATPWIGMDRPSDVVHSTVFDVATQPTPTETIDRGTAPEDVLTGGGRVDPSMELSDPGWITEGAELAAGDILDQYKRGEFSDVENRRRQLDREADQFEYEVMKRARDAAAQAGYAPGSAAYNELMQNAMSQANQNRLGVEQQINEMQRQYRTQSIEDLAAIEAQQRETAIGERGFQWTRADIDYMREQSQDLRTEEQATAFINNIQDPKLRANLQRALLTGGVDAVKAMANEAMNAFGTIEGDYASQDPFTNIKEAVESQVADMTHDPFTNKPITSEAQREEIKAKLINANILNQWGITMEGAEDIQKTAQLEQEANDLYMAIKAGDASPHELTSDQWDVLSEEQIREITIPFNDSMTYLRLEDWRSSGLQADNVYTKHENDAPKRQEDSVGAGNGSIVYFEGVPYRITRYQTKTKKPLGGGLQRKGVVSGVALSGPNKGKTKDLTSTDFQKAG